MIRPVYAHEQGGKDPRRVRNSGAASGEMTPMLPVYYNGKPLAGNYSYGNPFAEGWKHFTGETYREGQEAIRAAQDEQFNQRLNQMIGTSKGLTPTQRYAPLVAVVVLGSIFYALNR